MHGHVCLSAICTNFHDLWWPSWELHGLCTEHNKFSGKGCSIIQGHVLHGMLYSVYNRVCLFGLYVTQCVCHIFMIITSAKFICVAFYQYERLLSIYYDVYSVFKCLTTLKPVCWRETASVKSVMMRSKCVQWRQKQIFCKQSEYWNKPAFSNSYQTFCFRTCEDFMLYI